MAFAKNARLEILATPIFSNATSLTADQTGRVYFTDAVNRRIYRWNDADKKADVLAETTGQPQPQASMGFVKPATLLDRRPLPREPGRLAASTGSTSMAANCSRSAKSPSPRPARRSCSPWACTTAWISCRSIWNIAAIDTARAATPPFYQHRHERASRLFLRDQLQRCAHGRRHGPADHAKLPDDRRCPRPSILLDIRGRLPHMDRNP